jgi:hypothetical protein
MQTGVENSPIVRFLEWGLSAIGGAALTLVAVRTKIALLDRSDQDRKKEIADLEIVHAENIAKLEETIDERLKIIERRQWAALRMTADIANKVGVDGRFSDQLMKMLAQEDEPR